MTAALAEDIARAQAATEQRRAERTEERAEGRRASAAASLFQGPECEGCGKQKRRALPEFGWIWCYGCGDRRMVSAALYFDVEHFAQDAQKARRRAGGRVGVGVDENGGER